MKNQDPQRSTAAVADLSPKTLLRLKRAMQESGRQGSDSSGTEVRKTPRITRCPSPEVEVIRTIRFVPMDKETVERLQRDEDPRTSKRLSNANRVDSDLLEALRKAEPALLKWISQSDENAVLFALNPLVALTKAGVGIERDLIDRIRLIRQRNAQLGGPKPSVKVTRVKVKAGNT